MPENFTYNRVRELLDGLEDAGEEELRGAIAAARSQQIRGPLAVVIFVKHHLAGAHEAEVDRIEESEEGARYAVLVYPEGEVPIELEHLPPDVLAGAHVRYEPSAGEYR
ncbi:MAG: hypothetical protein QOF02_3896 [Blastocatellia bacterium]|jgi:hypothetical protein|nr:hypothetical protein [Blastocatellia bacterium]